MGPDLARRLAVLAALATCSSLAAGCGGTQETIRIGTVGDCYSSFSSAFEASAAGAELPFIERGAKPLGANPTDGVGSIELAGKRVELVLGCEYFGSDTTTIDALRRLITQQHVDIVDTNTGSFTDEFPTRPVERIEPGVTFLSTSLAPGVLALPNVFHVNPDVRDGAAGLGAYAYHTLGWRTAAVVGEDDPLGWSLAASFIAEFCSLGGTVTQSQRLWGPITITNWGPVVRKLDPSVDGVALTAGSQGVRSFITAYGKRVRDLPTHVVLSGAAIAAGARPLGVTGTGFLPFSSTARAWTAYQQAFHHAFPSYRGFVGTPSDVDPYDAVELALHALEQVHGDLSNGQRRFRAALTQVRVQTPTGPLQLGRDRNAEPFANYVFRVEKDAGGHLVPKTVGRIPGVEPTFNGYFTASSPADSETQPVCRRGHVPAWAR